MLGLGESGLNEYEISHKQKYWRRAWDLNQRRFPLPVFKTGALGRYASPPWANLPAIAVVPKFIREVLVSAQSPLLHHLLGGHRFETLHTSLNLDVHLPLPMIYLPKRA